MQEGLTCIWRLFGPPWVSGGQLAPGRSPPPHPPPLSPLPPPTFHQSLQLSAPPPASRQMRDTDQDRDSEREREIEREREREKGKIWDKFKCTTVLDDV